MVSATLNDAKCGKQKKAEQLNCCRSIEQLSENKVIREFIKTK